MRLIHSYGLFTSQVKDNWLSYSISMENFMDGCYFLRRVSSSLSERFLTRGILGHNVIFMVYEILAIIQISTFKEEK